MFRLVSLKYAPRKTPEKHFSRGKKFHKELEIQNRIRNPTWTREDRKQFIKAKPGSVMRRKQFQYNLQKSQEDIGSSAGFFDHRDRMDETRFIADGSAYQVKVPGEAKDFSNLASSSDFYNDLENKFTRSLYVNPKNKLNKHRQNKNIPVITTPAVSPTTFTTKLINPEVFMRNKIQKGLEYRPDLPNSMRILASSNYFNQKSNMIVSREATEHPEGKLALISKQWSSRGWLSNGAKNSLNPDHFLDILPTETAINFYQFEKSWAKCEKLQ